MANEEAGVGKRIDLTEWMTNLYERIKDQKLGDLAIPGTHDSGSFSPDMSGIARTQDQDLGQQLEDGIRCFDLRILYTGPDAWKPFEKNTFYLTHSKTTAKDLMFESQLDKIAQFAVAHPKEIIILEMAALATFDSLVPIDTAAVKADLGDLIINKLPRMYRPLDSEYSLVSQITVRDLADAGKNIIVISDENVNVRRLRRSFWPNSNIRGSWPYTQYLSQAGMVLADRLRGGRVDSPSGVADPFTEQGLAPGWFDGFRKILTKLLLRRDEEAQRHDPPETPPYTGVKAGDENIDLSQRLFKLEFGFSTFEIRTAVNSVNPYALDLLKKWEQGEAGAGPSGRQANTRKRVNVVSFDYYNHFDVVKTVVEMNQQRFPLPNRWQNLGRLKNGFTSELVVGQHEDGRQEVFAVSNDGDIWTNCQTRDDGKWAGWAKLKPSAIGFWPAKDSLRLAVELGRDGRMQLFACGRDDAIWNISQTSPNGGWGDWQTLGLPRDRFIPSDIAVGKTQDGRLVVHVTNRSDPFLWYLSQTGTNDVWESWKMTGTPTRQYKPRWLAVKQDSQGRQEIVVVSGSDLYRNLEQRANTNSFIANKFDQLGNPGPDCPLLDIIDVERNQDGRLEAFAFCSGKGPEQNSKRYVCHTWQGGPNKEWGKNWHDLGAPPRSSMRRVVVASHQDGRLAVFALDDDSHLWQVAQTKPNDVWGDWVPMTGSAPAQFGHHLQVGQGKDGSLWLFAYDLDHVLWGMKA